MDGFKRKPHNDQNPSSAMDSAMDVDNKKPRTDVEHEEGVRLAPIRSLTSPEFLGTDHSLPRLDMIMPRQDARPVANGDPLPAFPAFSFTCPRVSTSTPESHGAWNTGTTGHRWALPITQEVAEMRWSFQAGSTTSNGNGLTRPRRPRNRARGSRHIRRGATSQSAAIPEVNQAESKDVDQTDVSGRKAE